MDMFETNAGEKEYSLITENDELPVPQGDYGGLKAISLSPEVSADTVKNHGRK